MKVNPGSAVRQPTATPASRGLPLAALASPTTPGLAYYLVTAIDKWGRLADRTPAKVLQWEPGESLSFTADPSRTFIVIRSGGSEAVTSQGHLRVPLHLRHRFQLVAGDRLLLATAPPLGMVTAYPMSTVDGMVRALHAAAAGPEVVYDRPR